MVSMLIVFAAGVYVGIFLVSLMMMAKGNTTENYQISEIRRPSSQKVTPTVSTVDALPSMIMAQLFLMALLAS